MGFNYLHLQCYSEYSIKYGLLRLKDMVQAASKLGMPAIALTDQSNLCALVKFYQQAIKAGIKPIIGSCLWLENEAKPSNPYPLTLLCKNKQGYSNLVQLITKSYLQGQHSDKAIVKKAWLQEFNAGLIALAPALTSDVAVSILANDLTKAKSLINWWREVYPDSFYLAITRISRPREQGYLQAAVTLAEELQCPLVASNEVCFLEQDDFEAHEARVCINEGIALRDPNRQRVYTEQQYLKSAEQMSILFADVPEALANTVEIAKRCNLTLELGQAFLPEYPVPAGVTTEQYLKQQAQAGLKKQLAKLQQVKASSVKDTTGLTVASAQQKYWDRLELEIEVISNMGFAGYFLIVADFIAWSRAHDIPVGPGRGSGAGSLVAFALQITDIDPLEYDLLFERFLNPERVSMPDFDIDFCMEGRDRVIEYVAEKYGRDSVSQIMTFGTMAAKAVIRDVGRVLGHPYGFVDKIAKLIPFELGITLDKALAQEEALKTRYENEEEVKYLIDLAKKLEGITRNIGKHAGGVVIAASKLTDYLPLYCEPGEQHIITQFDKNDVESIGLVKFDFLGLRTLTIIHWAVQNINEKLQQAGKELLEIEKIPLTDRATFRLLCNAATTAVFQLESRGMKDLIAKLEPGCFEDIIALVALFRPGPLQSGMVEDFIERKKGIARIEYPHLDLEPILKPTYGVILYQEQVMQIAQILAGYTLGGADMLRRAMGKKKPEEMAKQREIFTQGAVKRGVNAEAAEYIFDLMEKFAAYGFNKSHSAAYALVSYQTAWLKTHYPAEFMAAVLSADLANTDKIVMLIDECRMMGLEVIPPSVNSSFYKFTVAEGKIIYGLGAIKGIGEAAINNIIEARDNAIGSNDKGFKDIFDFCTKIDSRKVNRRVIEALIYSGALDIFGSHRAQLMHDLADAISAAEQFQANKKLGQQDLFASLTLENDIQGSRPTVKISPWPTFMRLQGEKNTLGLYLTGHPINEFTQELQCMHVTKLSALAAEKKTARVAGFIINTRTLLTKRGDRMAFLTLDDCSARVDIVVFADLYATTSELLKKDNLVIVEGEASSDQYSGGTKIIAKKIMNMEEARINLASAIQLKVAAKNLSDDFIKSLSHILAQQTKGKCPVVLNYDTGTEEVRLRLGNDWLVRPGAQLIKELNEFDRDIIVKYEYL